MENTQEISIVPSEIKMPKNNKANRYYYKNRDLILEKKRIARNEKLVINDSTVQQMPLEERRKKKMELLGLLEPAK